jgi:hypothetical protein
MTFRLIAQFLSQQRYRVQPIEWELIWNISKTWKTSLHGNTALRTKVHIRRGCMEARIRRSLILWCKVNAYRKDWNNCNGRQFGCTQLQEEWGWALSRWSPVSLGESGNRMRNNTAVSTCLAPEDGNRSSFRNVVISSVFWKTGWWTKFKIPVMPSVIQHRQNPTESIQNRLIETNFGLDAEHEAHLNQW